MFSRRAIQPIRSSCAGEDTYGVGFLRRKTMTDRDQANRQNAETGGVENDDNFEYVVSSVNGSAAAGIVNGVPGLEVKDVNGDGEPDLVVDRTLAPASVVVQVLQQADTPTTDAGFRDSDAGEHLKDAF